MTSPGCCECSATPRVLIGTAISTYIQVTNRALHGHFLRILLFFSSCSQLVVLCFLSVDRSGSTVQCLLTFQYKVYSTSCPMTSTAWTPRDQGEVLWEAGECIYALGCLTSLEYVYADRLYLHTRDMLLCCCLLRKSRNPSVTLKSGRIVTAALSDWWVDCSNGHMFCDASPPCCVLCDQTMEVGFVTCHQVDNTHAQTTGQDSCVWVCDMCFVDLII